MCGKGPASRTFESARARARSRPRSRSVGKLPRSRVTDPPATRHRPASMCQRSRRPGKSNQNFISVSGVCKSGRLSVAPAEGLGDHEREDEAYRHHPTVSLRNAGCASPRRRGMRARWRRVEFASEPAGTDPGGEASTGPKQLQAVRRYGLPPDRARPRAYQLPRSPARSIALWSRSSAFRQLRCTVSSATSGSPVPIASIISSCSSRERFRKYCWFTT